MQYMQYNKIIKATTNKIEIGKIKYFQIPGSNVIVEFNGKKENVTIVYVNEFVDISRVSDTFWDQMIYPHLSDVFSKVDITDEMSSHKHKIN